MGLYDRLFGSEDPKIPVHAFMAAIGEIERGKMTEAQVTTQWAISAPAQAELTALVARIKTPLEGYPLSGRVTLTNVGASYDAGGNDSLSLPFIYIQRAGVTRMDLEVRVRKIGTGTQDWQLWDETNSVEAIGPATVTSGSLSDAGAAADRTLSASRVFPAPLSPGVVKLRLRARSSVATDDPIFLNASMLLFRVDRLTSLELHEVLLLAESRVAPVDSVAAMKARLGVS